MSKIITKEEALRNVHEQWIKIAYEKYPKEIPIINDVIRATSLKGNRSVRMSDYVEEAYPVDLMRFYIAHGFDCHDYPGIGISISW